MRFVQQLATRMSGHAQAEGKADSPQGNFLTSLSRRMSGHTGPLPPDEGKATNDDRVGRRMTITSETENYRYDLTADDAEILRGATHVKIRGENDEEIELDEIVVAPDGGWGWMVVLGSFLSNFVVDGLVFSYGNALVPIQESFAEAGIEVTVTSTGWIMSLLNGFYALGGPVAATLANRYGFRVTATIGSILASTGFALTYLFCRSKPNLIALYICNGIIGGLGCSLLYVSSVVSVGFYFEKHRAMSTGICVCGAGLGQTVFGTVFFYFLSQFGWKDSLLIEATLFLLCSFCASMYRPLEPKQRDTTAIPVENPEYTVDERSSSPGPSSATLTPQLASEASMKSPYPPARKGGIYEALVGNTLVAVDHNTGKREIYHVTDIKTINSPLFRDDIFLRGTMRRIPAYAQAVETGALSSAEWSVIVSRPDHYPVYGRKRRCKSCLRWLSSLRLLLSGSIMTSLSFLMMLLACSLIGMGLFIPYAYLEGMAKQNKLEASDLSTLFTVMGAANTAGRVFCGFIADLPKVRAEILLASALCVAGTSCVVLPLLGGYGFKLFIVYTITFGFFIAFFFSLLSVVLADLMGLEHLTNAFGIVGMFLGMFTILGTPFAGYLSESTEGFNLSFYVAGSMIIMSGIVIFPVKVVNRWEQRRKEKRQEQK